jgi:opacity protein-like surface antigen
MHKIDFKIVFCTLLFTLLISAPIFAQALEADSMPEKLKPQIYFRASAGPSMIATDPGMYFQNEIIFEFSKRIGLIGSYSFGTTYAGMKNLQRWYLSPEEPSADDFIRQQSIMGINIGMQASLINTDKHRLYLGAGPGMNYYNYSEGKIIPYGDSVAYIFTNKQTTRLALNYFAGYEYKALEHMVLAIGIFGSQSTEQLYAILLSFGYRF